MPIPGEYLLAEPPIEINAGRRTAVLRVTNTGDRAIQVGSHFHFFEANRALAFRRADSLGMRLDIPAGTAIRFEPGDSRDVDLVALAGTRRAIGFNGLVMGSFDAPETIRRVAETARERGFRDAAPPAGDADAGLGQP